MQRACNEVRAARWTPVVMERNRMVLVGTHLQYDTVTSVQPITHFERLCFANGTAVEPPPNGVVVFVGPNNAGKSTALGELTGFATQARFTYNNRDNRVFGGGSLAVPELSLWREWLTQFIDDTTPVPMGQLPGTVTLRNWNTQLVARPDETHAWLPNSPNVHQLQGFLISQGPQPQAFDGAAPDVYGMPNALMGMDNPQIQRLFLDPAIEARLRSLSENIFGVPIALNRYGRTASLHFGEIPVLQAPSTKEEIDQLLAVPRVSEQGEGVRALLALAIGLEIGREPLVFLDEPDAHLHPPQARGAGAFVAERAKRSQVFVSTHSMDFLLGLLQGDVPVTVIRLDRAAESQSVAVLGQEQLLEAWADPAVRFSGGLGGIMHKGVVLCEADGDSMYYETALDHLREGKAHDLRFVQTGGKQALKKLITALRPLGVPIIAIGDFDLLREWSHVRDLYEATGGDVAEIHDLWKKVDGQLNSRPEVRTTEQVLDELRGTVADLDTSAQYSSATRTRLVDALAMKGGWTEGKAFGLDAVKGDSHGSARQLLELLKGRGIYVLPFGELEDLHKEAPRNPKSAWLPYVLEHGLYKSLGPERKAFIQAIPDVCASAGAKMMLASTRDVMRADQPANATNSCESGIRSTDR
jgi:AAA domain, putative AbiEii toxin, Type IV TA system